MASRESGPSAYEVERTRRIAHKSNAIAAFLSVFLPPLAYLYVGKPAWGLLNLLTLNYGIVGGMILVPLHIRIILNSARERMDKQAAKSGSTVSRSSADEPV